MNHLLVDENLPSSLVKLLPGDCSHATDLGPQPSDTQLWGHARSHNWTILTRDTDFFDRLMLHGPPSKVIWVRLGNIRRADLEALLLRRWDAILQLLENADLVSIYETKLEGLSWTRS